jgi:outer membrane protein assembly factor BamB
MRAGPEGGWLYAVSPDGAVRWRQPLAGHGFTPADGSTRWTLALDHEDEMSFSAPAVGADGTIYFGVEQSPNSFAYAVNPDGTKRWKIAVPGGGFVRASPAIAADGTIYLTTRSGVGGARLVAVTPGGAIRWELPIANVHATPDDIYSTPSVGADGLVYFGAETGYVYAVRPDGTLDWSYDLRGGINWCSPVIAGDGAVYLGGIGSGFAEGVLSKVRTSSPGYAASPWPRFRHDDRNTGRSGGP